MAERTQYPKRTTGRGTAIWPRLNEPDTKFDSDGKYECALAFDGDDETLLALEAEATKLAEAKLEEIRDELISKGKKAAASKLTLVNLVREEEDDDTGEPTGRRIIKATMKASGVTKAGKPWKRRPDLFDGKGNKMTNPPAIGSGSICKMNVELFPYYAANDKTVGCTFRLNGVQVIKLVSFGERNADEYGFGAEDDGDEIDEVAGQDFSDESDDDDSEDEDL